MESLLIAKMAWLLLLCGGYLTHAGHPYVPFFASMDAFREVPVYSAVLPAVFLGGGAALLFNAAPRFGAFVAGACVLAAQAQSIAAWRSHEAVCATFLILGSLQDRTSPPWFLRVELTLCLLATLLDRPFAHDWSGEVTLEGWDLEQGSQPLLALLRLIIPAPVLGLVAGWGVTVITLAVATGLWLRRIRKMAIWVGCMFHLAAYAILGSREVALYTCAMLMGYLAFLDWPRQSVVALWPRACGWPMALRVAFDRYDWDRMIEWPFPENPDADLEVWVDNCHATDRDALRALLLFFPSFHFGVFAAAMIVYLTLPEPWSLFAHGLIAIVMVAIFAWLRPRKLRPAPPVAVLE